MADKKSPGWRMHLGDLLSIMELVAYGAVRPYRSGKPVSRALLGLLPFAHVLRLLLDQVCAGPLIGLVTAALVLTAIGLIGLQRRDIGRV